MLKIDAHQHFWHFTEEDYGWIGENENVIKRDFLPAQLSELLAANDLDGCVAVQARQSQQETDWLLELSEQHDFVKGVVGWADLRADNLGLQLQQYKNRKKLKGFRHVIQGEPDPNFMLEPDFVRGLNTLVEFGYVYDLLILAHQLPQALELVKLVPDLRIVVDHIAKPKIASGEGFEQWQTAMTTLGQYQNIYCKVSGMVTEADVSNWHASDFTPYLACIFKAFGSERVMFGSDWPVCLLGGSYSQIKQIVVDYVNSHFPEAYDQVFGGNAVKFYQL